VIFGGSEQCTPPMMRPEAFDEYVVPYEGPLLKQLKGYGVAVESHCHGKVRYALSRMMEIGYDATNPIEPPPQGNVTYAEARALTRDKLTLEGNLEFLEIEYSEPEHIALRVKEIMSLGWDRLIITDAGGLNQAVTERMDMNYRSWVDSYLNELG